jgi:tol-pal system protein YbgF
VTPLSRLLRASAVLVCAGVVGASGAYAFDLNPFNRNAPPQTAQNAPPAVIPGIGPDSGDPNDPASMVVRLDRLENDLRQANGRIEELENQAKVLQDQLKRFQQDVEFRLGGAPPASAAAPPAPGAAPPIVAVAPGAAVDLPPGGKPVKRSDAFDPNADPNAPGAPRPLGSTTPSAPLSAAGPPLDISAIKPAAASPATPAGPLVADVAPPPAAGPAPAAINGAGIDFTDAPREQFAAAVEAYRNGDYAKAEDQLKAFIVVNASHRLVPDAIFYLGETYFQRSRPREAAEQYLKLSTDYAKSARAPEGMLRLGQSLAALGSNEQACATLAEVGKRYPTAAPAVKKSAEREMQKDHC